MKAPTVASQKKVTTENLARLGAERLAEILVGAADARPELKRRLRMELAAEQGADHLAAEIDRRLGSIGSSRGRIGWRQRGAFVRDLEALRALIADRLAGLDRLGALTRLLSFLALARPVDQRLRDRDGALAAVFVRAAGDVAPLLASLPTEVAAAQMVEAMAADPARWSGWLDAVLAQGDATWAAEALRLFGARAGASPGWVPLIRRLAEAAGNLDAYLASFTPAALKTPEVAAEAARRLLDAGDTARAGKVLAAAKGGQTHPDWEAVWIDWLEASGDAAGAQGARWAAFERSLYIEPLRAFTRRLPEFEDVEAEHRAFAHAAAHTHATRALAFLMDWPALPEAAQLVQARGDELQPEPDQAELWAARLRVRHPAAAERLLRKAAATAFRRRDFKTSDRLTAEADAIG